VSWRTSKGVSEKGRGPKVPFRPEEESAIYNTKKNINHKSVLIASIFLIFTPSKHVKL
jgi:hypothetical protein